MSNLSSTAHALPNNAFQRFDQSDDEFFYVMPRLVVHIDDGAIQALSAQFAQILPPGGVYLDLMSSWRSHLPETLQPARVVGLGMNAHELAENPQLDAYLVHNVNREPILTFADGEFDAAICTVSVQYMTRPIEIFREVSRVLKPTGSFVVAFSNRCFPTKAIAAWRAGGDAEHIALVKHYFATSGDWSTPQQFAFTPADGDPLFIVWAHKQMAATRS